MEQLRDILHAEKQLVKELPKMAKAARSGQLERVFEVDLEETEAQAERLNECLASTSSARSTQVLQRLKVSRSDRNASRWHHDFRIPAPKTSPSITPSWR